VIDLRRNVDFVARSSKTDDWKGEQLQFHALYLSLSLSLSMCLLFDDCDASITDD